MARDIITMEWLQSHGRLLVSQLNHREYLCCGIRYVCRYISTMYKYPGKPDSYGAWGWIVTKAYLDK